MELLMLVISKILINDNYVVRGTLIFLSILMNLNIFKTIN